MNSSNSSLEDIYKIKLNDICFDGVKTSYFKGEAMMRRSPTAADTSESETAHTNAVASDATMTIDYHRVSGYRPRCEIQQFRKSSVF